MKGRAAAVGLLLLALCSLAALWGQSEDEKPPPPQPVPFNHKAHAAVGLKCLDCHGIRKPGFAAGYPASATCMACHIAIKADSPDVLKLAEYDKAKRAIPWVKIYRLPDYVWFSHQVHYSEAKVACETCHGPVAEREIIVKEKPISMASCMECHAEHGASNQCDICHDPR